MADDYTAAPSIAEVRTSELLRTGFRAGHRLSTVAENLGLLTEFQGNWRGTGFNITARPFFGSDPPFFLELNATQETLDFNAISGDIPNRGSRQPDINLHGLRYLQQVTDAVTNFGIHVEPGLWLRVPATEVPESGESYVRQATTPHGDSLLAQSSWAQARTGYPTIDPVCSIPFRDAVIPGINTSPSDPVTDPHYLAQYLESPLPTVGLPPGLNAAEVIRDPTKILRAQIDGQHIVTTDVIKITTVAPGGGILNIPFVTNNANAVRMDAIFWLETVRHANGQHFVQLQYLQRVILHFTGIYWPHFSLATLVRI
jgi:hypothetical protein